MTTVYRLLLVPAVSVFALTAQPVHAQPAARFFVGGNIGTFSVSSDDVDGQSAAGGFLGGVALSRIVDVAVEWTRPASAFTESSTAIGVSFAPPGSSREEIERQGVLIRYDRRREVASNISAFVILHPPRNRRVTPGVLIGVTNQHARNSTTYTPVTIPPGVDPQHPAVRAQKESAVRNLGGPTFGANLDIAITPRLSIVPEVRYDYGSIGDEINNVLRSGVGVFWRF
jgi:hypothetical protein